jgi:hypothetical protein
MEDVLGDMGQFEVIDVPEYSTLLSFNDFVGHTQLLYGFRMKPWSMRYPLT